MTAQTTHYYVPDQSKWPIIASTGIFLTLFGAGKMLIDRSNPEAGSLSHWIFFAGALIIAYMMFGWFRNVIHESRQGLYSDQMDRSFRMGMTWFIFSEVMFFAAFFGVLFYVRFFAVPWIGGEGDKEMTKLLWEGFTPQWPLLQNPNPELFPGPEKVINPWHLPLINTVLLVTSSFTLTFAHHALKKMNRSMLAIWLFLTVALGCVFLGFQIEEYIEAYTELGLRMDTGIYASTFFMLTGFHGAHVTLGTIMLLVMFFRVLKGHFTPDNHFGFEAVAWYWHFVDVVWIGLFIFVYVI